MAAHRKHPLRRRLIMLVIVLIVLVGGGYWVKETYFTQKVTPARTAAVTRGDIEETVLATGILKPVKLVAVGAQVSGKIVSLKVKLGDKVKKGDVVALIDSTTQDNDLRTAKAALENVRAQKAEQEATLKLYQQNLARQEKNIDSRAISQADYDEAVSNVATAKATIASLEAQIEEAEVAVETAEANVGYTRITATMDGTVLAIGAQEGQTVNANQTTPTIVVLGQLSTMTVKAEISEADITKVKPGQSVYFTVLSQPGKRYNGTLKSIDPAPEDIISDSSISSSTSSSSSSSAIYYYGNFDIPNPDNVLRTYMTAEVHVVLGHSDNALLIPASALKSKNSDGTYKVLVDNADGSYSSRNVKIGLNDKINAEVLDGLKEGDKVVTGQLDGSLVKDTGGRRGPPPMGL